MKIIILFFKVLIALAKDVYKTFAGLTKCNAFDIIELIGFGLVVNTIYGVMKEPNILDVLYTFVVIYGTLKVKNKKEQEC